MARRVLLHIGGEKTGTTALQLAFREDSERLAGLGVRYPDLGAPIHAGLVYCAADEHHHVADLESHIGLIPNETREAFCERLHDRLAHEVKMYQGMRFVLSTEHAHSRLVSAESIARMRSLLARHFDEIEIAVYLRRWDRMATSFHATSVRNGVAGQFSFAPFLGSTLLDYRRLLDRWAEAFGESHLHVGVFDRGELVNGSILDDFTQRFGLPKLSPVADQNVSLDAAGQALMALVDEALVELAPAQRGSVRAAIAASLRPQPATPLPIPRDVAREFVRHYDDDAAAICQRWFPGRAALFDNNFDEYAEIPQPVEHSWREVAAAMANALADSTAREAGWRAETHYYRAMHHRDAGRIDLAESEAREAAQLCPQSLIYWVFLTDILVRADRLDDARTSIEEALRIDPASADAKAYAQHLGLS